MQFSDTSNDTGLIQDITFLTGIGTTEYTTKDRTRNINAHYHRIVTMILESQDGWGFDDINHADFPILTTSLVADQQDYSLPASEKILKIKRVEITYDGTNWYKAEPFDINERGLATDTTSIGQDFVQAQPKYDVEYNSIFLYPIPDATSTNGLKIWISREIDEFASTDTTQEPGFDEPFHRMLSVGASLDYALARGKANANALQTMLLDYEARLKQHYSNKNRDRKMILKSAYIDYQ